jgi:hypothetical protein
VNKLSLINNCKDFFELVNYYKTPANGSTRKSYQDSFISFKFVKSILNIPTPNNDKSILYVKCSASDGEKQFQNSHHYLIQYYTYKHHDSAKYVGPVDISNVDCKPMRYLLKDKDASNVVDFFVLSDSLERVYIGTGLADGYTMKDYFSDKKKYADKKRD